MENGNGLNLATALPSLAEVESTAKDVSELQSQIQQLLGLQKEAESQNQKLAETLSKEQAHTNGTAAPAAPVAEADSPLVLQLEHELQVRTEERENYKNKLQLAEKRIVELEEQLAAKSNETGPMTDKERASTKETLENMTDTLKSTTVQCDSFQRQNTQLQSQVKALKEVIAVHKDLLSIRGLETDQLKTTIKLLEDHALAEKERRNAVLNKMETAVKLNAELKTEYENQLRIFQDLKGKYELKVELMKAENETLRAQLPQEVAAEIPPEEPVLDQ